MGAKLLSALLFGGLVACSAGSSDGTSAAGAEVTEGKPVFTAEAERLWAAHVDRMAEVPLQDNCSPRRISPPKGTPSRGVIVLFHGYTGCPQQYFDSGKRLSAEGYDVLLPLLPGQGRYWTMDKGNVIDRLDGMVGTENWQSYADAAHEMIAIAQQVNGERIVGGLSVGGVVATEAVLAAPTLWTRALIMSPFYDTSNALARVLVPIADAIVPDHRTSWGPSCEAERDVRAGTCQFTFDELQAARDFGAATVAKLAKTTGITGQIQIAGVEGDQAAFDDRIREAATMFPQAQTSLCFFEKGTNHSFLSRYDEHAEDKFWLPAAEDQVVTFLTKGTPFMTVGTSVEPSSLRCKTRE